MSQQSFLSQPASRPAGPVECLGMTFESDEARRTYFTEKLRGKLRDPEFRQIEGFPRRSFMPAWRSGSPSAMGCISCRSRWLSMSTDE